MTLSHIAFPILMIKKQANYINALAVSVLRLFEPAEPNTLGDFFLHWVIFFSRLIFLFLCNVR
jgi:hypothetical protein